MSAETKSSRPDWVFWACVACVFFFLLGSRSLNEPDEGRYGEIAREMVETGNWLVPTIYYVPHLDKPPMTYWAVALSIKTFGLNEWAVRLPLALAGLSGACVAWLLGLSLGTRSMARWSVVILSTSLLYFGMARMLTTDMILSQFIAWSCYCFWRSWRCLDGFSSEQPDERARAGKQFFLWQVGMWVALSGGFLTKGPIAPLIPFLAGVALILYRRKEAVRWQMLLLGTAAGLLVFGILAVPWYVTIFQQVPHSFDFMVKGQVVGHAMGGEAKNRSAPFYYFFGILAMGLLPWTLLLGWLWRRTFWRTLAPIQRDGWLFLSVWAISTFTIFSINSSKLPAYIVPMFPALAVLIAMRWPDWQTPAGVRETPRWVWPALVGSPFLTLLGLPFVYWFAFKATDQYWVWAQAAVALAALIVLPSRARDWPPERCAREAARWAVVQLVVIVAFLPRVETQLRSNQTLREVGVGLRTVGQPGDRVIFWNRLPQGVGMYAYPAVNASNPPYLGGMPENRLPFEFPGNIERLGERLLSGREQMVSMLESSNRTWVVAWEGTYDRVNALTTNTPLHLIVKSGTWELFGNTLPAR